MSSDLDERMRQRFAALFEPAPAGEEDLVARARALGIAWRAEQRARRRRQWWGGGVVLVAAAGVVLGLRGGLERAGGRQPMAAVEEARWPVRAPSVLPSPSPLASPSPSPSVLPSPSPSPSPSTPTPTPTSKPTPTTGVGLPLMAAGDEGCRLPRLAGVVSDRRMPRTVGLGEFGRLVTGTAADWRVLSSSACELRIGLNAGSLAGELHALRPGRLVIQTPEGSVIVTGTRFAVRAGHGKLDVILASGTVSVELRARPALQLAPGRSLVLRERGAEPVISPLTAADSLRLDQLLDAAGPGASPAAPASPPMAAAPVRNPSPAPSEAVSRALASNAAQGTDLLAKAEAARRRGQIDTARNFYAAAADGGDANAEVAVLRWARLELERHAVDRAAELLARHARAFAAPQLAAEAAWLDVQVLIARADVSAARSAAEQLVRVHASTPQARAARAWLNRR